ncbi:TPA: hypothetical protein ACSTL0_001793 [Serratia fonticola]
MGQDALAGIPADVGPVTGGAVHYDDQLGGYVKLGQRRSVVYHVPSWYGMPFMDSKEQGMFDIISDLVSVAFRIIYGILEAIYEIVNFIYSFTKGRRRIRVLITVLVFLALLGLFYWWIVNASQ